MTKDLPTREDAYALLTEYTKSESLLNHALAVEGVMRYFAKKNNENEDEWGIIGLAHDLDYEKFPNQHCQKTQEILEEKHWPETVIRAIVSHGWGVCNDIEPKTSCEKTLYAVDELVGFVTACALVRPTKSVIDLEVKSVQKKWKQKSFAAGANREVIEKGAAMLNIELKTLIAEVIQAMRPIAHDIGLGLLIA